MAKIPGQIVPGSINPEKGTADVQWPIEEIDGVKYVRDEKGNLVEAMQFVTKMSKKTGPIDHAPALQRGFEASMKKPHTITINKGDGLTPSELQEGLASGKYKLVDPDEKIDVEKHKKFITVPKGMTMQPRLDYRQDGIMARIPEGATHRVLDIFSTHVGHQRMTAIKHDLYRAHHFKLGFEASEYLLGLTVDDILVEELQSFAPHPFDNYTVSLWIGMETGEVAEAMITVHDLQDGTHGVSLMFLPWGSDNLVSEWKMFQRAEIADSTAPATARLGWLICDAFRLLMSRPAGRTIVKGGPPRTALRKGKRVHFYSASEIKIDLDAAKKDRIVGGGGYGKMMPVYQYRAHLCHSGGLLRGCEHEWIEIGGIMRDGKWFPDKDHPKQNPNWECYHCGRRRWHRKAGSRGSAEVGYVRQTYNVTKGNDE